ncbi:MAG: hypothetical protein IJJ38_08230 [Lachnospiraceae bacterium]|nr:hypothetical protein [Lachnospiraceae bacterium]
MNTPYITVIAVGVLITAAFSAMILTRRRASREQLKQEIKACWGTDVPRRFFVIEEDKARKLSDRESAAFGASCRIDDITASDLDLYSVTERIGHPMSAAGAEVLFAWLRHPLLENEPLKKREALIARMTADEEGRREAQMILAEIGSVKGDSFYGQMEKLDSAEEIGGRRFLLPGLLTLVSLALLFVYPPAAVVLLVLSLVLNFRIHLRMREVSGEAVRGFQCVLRLLEAADRLRKLPLSEVNGMREEMDRIVSSFSDFRRGSFWVARGGSVGTGLADAVLEYIKMFFHVDLIRFDVMLKEYRKRREDAVSLLLLVGGMDAAQAAADYRAAHPDFCIPDITDRTEGGGRRASLCVRDLVHPLLSDPVPNSIETDREILLTGSNASGKSTFLKSVILSAVMAQSIHTVPASAYRASFFRIYTSMALTDNLSGGESYFIVEIRSLKRICDAAETDGPPVLAAVDEVLRGTNTIERIAASSHILKSLAVPNVLLFAATHDIELAGLLASDYRNFHFGESVLEGDVRFDYILREGKAEGRNALHLLRASGYREDVVSGAAGTAEHFEETGEWRL